MEIYCKSCDKVLGNYPDEKIPPGVKGYTSCKICGEKITIYREIGKPSAAEPTPPSKKKASLAEEASHLPHKKDWGIKRADALTVLLLILTTIATVVFAKPDFDLSKRFPRDLTFEPTGEISAQGIYEIEKSAHEIKRHKKPINSISIDEIAAIRKKLATRKFEELNNQLNSYQSDLETDPVDEFKIFDAYSVFDTNNKLLEPLLQEWQESFPDKYQPYLALARYYSTRGWLDRWDKKSAKTADEKIALMNDYFTKAEKNARKAIGIKENLLPAYQVLIRISNTSTIGGNENDHIEKGLELFPHSYVLRVSAMWAKQPRWGGSYRAMERIAREAEKYAQINPVLTNLYGDIYLYQGIGLNKKSEREKALQLFNMALSYGEDCGTYSEIANIYYGNKEYNLALQNINRSIDLRPIEDSYYRLRAKIHLEKKRLALSLEDINKALLLKPDNPENGELLDKIMRQKEANS